MINSKILFLLGGKDLEMITIKELLEDHKIPYIDRNLEWGASVTDYSDIICSGKHSDKTIYGIELTEPKDWQKPGNYKAIDHHNVKQTEKSSLEQVSDITGIKLNRRQQLVAANDSGYIPELLRVGASWDEVLEIRQADRKAQGVSPEDEELAEMSIKNHLTFESGITVVKALTKKFSPIADRLYPTDKLLIYTYNELTYYGKGVTKLAQHFGKLVSEKKAYYGSGENGFFGIAEKAMKPGEIKILKNKITEILK
jgi:hypothetical protein